MSIGQLELIQVMQRVRRDNPFMTTLELLQAEQQYRNFLELNRLYPQHTFVPTSLADRVWHAHLLFSAKYRQDCMAFVGRMLEHNPVTDEAEDDKLLPAKETTARKYQEHFGYWPGQKDQAATGTGCFAG